MGLLFKLLLFVVAIAVILMIHQVYTLDCKVELLKEELESASRTYRISEIKEEDNKWKHRK